MELNLKNHFNITDEHIFLDIQNYRKHDTHKLLKRLDTVHKNIVTKSENGTVIKSFLKLVIDSYCSCTESMKLARSVEKLLQPWKPLYTSYMREVLKSFMDSIMAKVDPDFGSLIAVSNLLEQNILAQEVVEGQLSSFLIWLRDHLTKLMSASPYELSISQAGCLYALIKVTLQLFQSCAKRTCSNLWSSLVDSDMEITVTIVSQILGKIYSVLQTDGYGSDCVQLTGTTFALALSAAPDPGSTVCAFWSTFNSLNSRGSHFNIREFRNGNCSHTHNCEVRQSLGALSLVKGIIVCGSKDVLLYQDNTDNFIEKGGNSVNFLIHIFPVIRQFCEGPIKFHYHAFSLLHLWFRKFIISLSDTQQLELTKPDKIEILDRTLDLVYLNWDSPVEDVSDIIGNVFKLFLESWEITVEYDSVDNRRDIPREVLAKLLNTQWYVKGKYRILAALLPYLDNERVLDKNPEIKQQLLKCLSTNYLAPSASNVYKAFLHHIQKEKEEDWKGLWSRSWLDTVCQGLMSSDSLVRNNANHYWIQSTMKILPPVGQFLQEHLSSILHSSDYSLPRQRVLHAWVVVSKVIRTLTGAEVKDTDLLRETLYSNDEDIRADGIALICCSLKKSEPLSARDSSLLCEVLPDNLKVDSAPYRQHLVANMKSLLVRIRDSCLTMLKSETYEELDTALDFIEWLLRLCVDNLLPGACYQRRKACLDLLRVTFDTLTYQEHAKQRKAFTPESIKSLEKYVREKQIWDFYCYDNAVCLLHCVCEGADEIQELAADLLMRYFPWPLSPTSGPDHKACHMLSHALTLCNSPKPSKSQSGALLCKIVFIKYVVERDWTFEMELENSRFSCTTSVNSSVTDQRPSVQFLSHLLYFIQRTLRTSQVNVVQASKESPIHGLVTACTRCLTDNMELFTEELDQVVVTLIETNMEIITTMLKVMAKDSKNEDCPSFAEIGIALENLISENQAEYTETTSLSAEHQYLLSWCWINLKESCLSIGQLTGCLLQQRQVVPSLIRDISAVFLRVLTQCRHRGVIEGCRSSFINFVFALFDSNDVQFNQLPQHILQEAVKSLESKALTTSVTRKSAGLPIIIQTIVACERKYKRSTLLQFALDELFRISALLLDLDLDDRHDLPQVHGLNILKSLYGDASLTSSLMPYISTAVQVVVNSFSSPAWSIRNAATRLFSALVTRIYGHKKTTEDSRNSISLPEFAAYYPELPPFMLEHLDKAVENDIRAIDKLHPALFPIMTLLAKLNPTEVHQGDGSLMNEFNQRVDKLLGSPVYYLRQLTASASVALVPLQKGEMTMRACVKDIPETMPMHASNDFNLIHGRLLCLEKMLTIHNISDAEGMLHLLLTRKWIFCDASVCSLVKEVYLSVVTKLLPQATPDQRQYVLDMVTAQQAISGQILMIGSSILCKKVVNIFLSLQIAKGDNSEVVKLLQHTDMEFKLATVSELLTLIENNMWDIRIWHQVQKVLLQTVTREMYSPLLDKCLSLVTQIHIQYGTEVETQAVIQQLCSSVTDMIEDRGRVAANMLRLKAIGVHCVIEQKKSDWSSVEDWCQQVFQASTMTGDEHCRLAAAHGILITGQSLLSSVGQSRETTTMQKERCVVQLTQACVNLLQDDDTDVRDIVVEFLSQFAWNGKTVKFKSIQCNSCLKLLFKYVSSTFWWSQVFLAALVDMLYKPEDVRRCIQDKLSSSHQQLFDQEDNSFFAEKVFSGFMIYKAIKEMIITAEEKSCVLELNLITDHLQKLSEDICYILEVLQTHCTDKPVWSVFSDSTVLAAVSACMLLSRLYIQVTCGPSHSSTLQEHFNSILQNPSLPPAFKNILSSVTQS